MYVCLCKGLTESDVRKVIVTEQLAEKNETDRLAQRLGLDDDDCCGRCVKNIRQLMALSGHCQGCSAVPMAQSASQPTLAP